MDLAGAPAEQAQRLYPGHGSPGQVDFVPVLAALAGLSVSTAHVLPEAIFPDVIEWDELRTRRQREGIYYGVKNSSAS